MCECCRSSRGRCWTSLACSLERRDDASSAVGQMLNAWGCEPLGHGDSAAAMYKPVNGDDGHGGHSWSRRPGPTRPGPRTGSYERFGCKHVMRVCGEKEAQRPPVYGDLLSPWRGHRLRHPRVAGASSSALSASASPATGSRSQRLLVDGRVALCACSAVWIEGTANASAAGARRSTSAASTLA